MYSENTTWFNQSIFSYRDNIFGSNSTLELSISSNTNDFKYFSAPNLMITIIADSDRSRKNCNLSYVDLIDLVLRLRQIQKDISYTFESGAEILCKYQKMRTLKFSFKIAESNQQQVVEIEIRHNESDFGKIYIPYGTIFLALIKKLETYANTCDQLSLSLVNRYLMTSILEVNNGMRNEIRGIPEQIACAVNPGLGRAESVVVAHDGDDAPAFKSVTTSEDVEKYTGQKLEDDTQDNFSGFIDENIDNIKIPEMEKIENNGPNKAHREFNSPLVYNILNGKIETIENLLYAVIAKPNPFIEFINTLKPSYEKDVLPQITDEEMNSYAYLSCLIFHTHLQNYSRTGTPIPSTTNILKYKSPEKIDTYNIELMYDILTLGSYIKIMRERIEDKEGDAMNNKSVLHLAFRCFTDILLFSFINKVDKNAIKSCVLERFNTYKEKGVFNTYNEILISYSCTPVTVLDMDTYVSGLVENVVGKGDDILTLHNDLYNADDVKLPSINNFNLEQINDLIKVEVEYKLGNYDNIDKASFSEDIISLFEKKKKITAKPKKDTVKKETVEKDPHVYRLVYQYRNEIPERLRETLLSYLKGIEKNDVVWEFETEIEEMGDNILKAIYAWNESEKGRSGTYKNFVANNFEQCMLTKDLILAKLKIEDNDNSEESNEWDKLDF